ncbi:MAG: ATP-dependent Clp protease ATP-binding subunit [Minisyncoccia bacterium]|jgi:ATP-dependent Clp protease ATP-binding subunit ClpC
MPQEDSNRYELRFDDPRLKMTIAGRFTVRVVSYITNLVLLFATATLLISEIRPLRYAGIFLGLVFLDRLVHWGEADLPIAELPSQGKINLAWLLTPAAFSALARAFDYGLVAKQNFFLCVTGRLIDLPRMGEGLRRLDVKPDEFKAKFTELLTEPVSAEMASHEEYQKSAEVLVAAAFGEALTAGHNFIEPSDLFSALAKVKSDVMDRLFHMFGIEAGDLETALIFSSARRSFIRRFPRAVSGFIFESNRHLRHRIMNRAWTARPTPTLDRYGTDFTDLARAQQVGFLIGHDAEYERLVETLGRPMNPNALLVGEPGIGKEALVQHLAFALTKDKVPKALFDKRLVSIELQNLVAGAPPEELSARLKKIVEEIYMAGNIIIYIPDIHNLVHTSGTAYLSAADVLMPVIKDNAFPVVGATYPREFKQLIEPRSDFVGAFEVIHMNEVTEAEAGRILTYESILLEQKSRVVISFGAVKCAVTLAKKYFRDKLLPSSAEELLKSALVDAEERSEKTLTADRVMAVAEAKVHMPIREAGAEESEKLLHLEEIIHERLVDQEEAVTAVAEALREYRSGLTRKGGPIASFLFVGPTGVGKTELAKTLAKVQFGSEQMMVRFDMTEYQDKASYSRFIGSPDGATRGALTDAIHDKPYSLVLLDEFEKAFPDILNLFLQVFDDGRLTDSLDRTIDFTNTIIIATSNAHSDIINESLAKGESMTDIAEYLKKRLIDVFKPELLNRFSKIVIFRDLGPKELGKIVELNLKELAETVKDQGIALEFDPAAVAQLVKLGYDPAFGARPLRRVIDEKLKAPLSRTILSKKIGRGSRVKLVLTGDAFDFVDAAQ